MKKDEIQTNDLWTRFNIVEGLHVAGPNCLKYNSIKEKENTALAQLLSENPSSKTRTDEIPEKHKPRNLNESFRKLEKTNSSNEAKSGSKKAPAQPSLENLDLLVSKALEIIVKASTEASTLEEIKEKESIYRLGRAAVELLKVQEEIHESRSNIRPDIALKHEKDKTELEKSDNIQKRICVAENQSDLAVTALQLKKELKGSGFDYL